jgi:N-methylhydantoinase A
MNIEDGIRVAIDIGGTFTDCVILNQLGERHIAKSLTTYEDPAIGVINCLNMASERLGIDCEELVSSAISFVHGTTVGTNALTQLRGARTGLLMTKGHEETILIGRARQKVIGLSEREKIHVTHLEKASPSIVLPEDICPVIERIDSEGNILVSLDLAQVEKDIDLLVQSGIESLAVCLLWAFKNPVHEQAILAIVQKKYPDLFISISSVVAPRLGEYERSVSTVFNSYIGPIVGDYLVRLETKLKALGMKCSLLVIQSSGGLCTVDSVIDRPLLTVDSGPAGGVLGAKFYARLIREESVICADVGGTTFDVGLVYKDHIQMDLSPVIGKYTYLVPKVFVKSVGAGGGSIAWIDDGGILRVGPRSAGSDPGPAAYGHGGTQATVTDAHVALGYLDPEYLLGGKVRLDKVAAVSTLTSLANKLNMSITELAAGIIEISNAQMADLVRKVTVERGLDPRNFTLFVYGGAGPIFGAFLAKQVGVRLAYIPADSGVFSALGMLTTDIELQEEISLGIELPMSDSDLVIFNEAYRQIDEKLKERFVTAGFDPALVALCHKADMRFGMQVHELEVAVKNGFLGIDEVDELSDLFVNTYETIYGRGSAYKEAGIELVTIRSIGSIELSKPNLEISRAIESNLVNTNYRDVFFSPHGFIKTAIYAGDILSLNQIIKGPAIIQRFSDTVVIPPEMTARVDVLGGIILEFGADSLMGNNND